MAGWLTLISWQAGCAGAAYVSGTLVQGLLILNYPKYGYQRWHGTLLFYAFTVLALFVNTYLGRLLPRIEPMMLLVHVLGFFAILIPLVYFSPHQRADFVFQEFLNLGGWSGKPLSFFVGLITALNCFLGELRKIQGKIYLLNNGLRPRCCRSYRLEYLAVRMY